jgi:hypothetical protein
MRNDGFRDPRTGQLARGVYVWESDKDGTGEGGYRQATLEELEAGVERLRAAEERENPE